MTHHHEGTLTCCSTLADLDAWLDFERASMSVRRSRGKVIVELYGPRGALRARGLAGNFVDAVARAVRNFEAGIVP